MRKSTIFSHFTVLVDGRHVGKTFDLASARRTAAKEAARLAVEENSNIGLRIYRWDMSGRSTIQETVFAKKPQ